MLVGKDRCTESIQCIFALNCEGAWILEVNFKVSLAIELYRFLVRAE